MLSTDAVLTLSHDLQPWRPDAFTLEMLHNPPRGFPFCGECADWHEAGDVCSLSAKDG